MRNRSRRIDAASAALGARWCWVLLKGAVLAVILVRDGTLQASLRGDLSSAIIFFLFFTLSAILYIALSFSDPVCSKYTTARLRSTDEVCAGLGSATR